MNYDAFRQVGDDALFAADLLTFQDRPEESTDLRTMTRRYSVRLGMFRSQATEPFTGGW